MDGGCGLLSGYGHVPCHTFPSQSKRDWEPKVKMRANLVPTLSQHAGEERLLTRDRTPYEGAILTAGHLSGPSPNVLQLGVGNLSHGFVRTLTSAD